MLFSRYLYLLLIVQQKKNGPSVLDGPFIMPELDPGDLGQVFPDILVASVATDFHPSLTCSIGMAEMQGPFAREGMTQSASITVRAVKRHMARGAGNGQRPVANPHLRVTRIGIGQAAGGAIPVSPAALNTAGYMGIMESTSRTAFESVMTTRRGAAVDITIPQIMLTRRMAGHAIAAAGRDARLQVWNSCMTEGAISTMGDINR